MRSLGGLKIPLLDSLFILLLIILGGNASIFTREYGNHLNLSTFIPLGFAFIIGLKNKILPNYKLVICIGGLIFYWILASLVNGYFSFGFICYWIVTLIICYICCQSYGVKFIDYFESIVFYLTIISMVFWVAYLIFPNIITSFCESIRWGESFSDHAEVINIGVYTILDMDFSDEWHLFYRNSGFAWEPGSFSVFLCFAIACNIFRKENFVLKGNFPLVLYLIALFSAESTTGGMTLIIIIVFWLLSSKKSSKTFLYLILLIPIFIGIISLDFVGAKLMHEYEEATEITIANATQSTWGVSRLGSLVLYFQEFLENPIFGLAGNPTSPLKAQGFFGSLHSGIGDLLADYGIILSFIYVYFCVITNKYISILTGKKYLVIIAALLGSMVSYSMWKSPIFFTFVILGIFMTPECTYPLKDINKSHLAKLRYEVKEELKA